MGPEVQCGDVLSGATCSPSSLGVAATSGAPADTYSVWNPVWVCVTSFLGQSVQCADVLHLGPADTSSVWNPVWVFVTSFLGRSVQCADVLSADCSIWGRLILPACQIIVATRNGTTHHHMSFINCEAYLGWYALVNGSEFVSCVHLDP